MCPVLPCTLLLKSSHWKFSRRYSIEAYPLVGCNSHFFEGYLASLRAVDVCLYCRVYHRLTPPPPKTAALPIHFQRFSHNPDCSCFILWMYAWLTKFQALMYR